jgi:hypothetical protein
MFQWILVQCATCAVRYRHYILISRHGEQVYKQWNKNVPRNSINRPQHIHPWQRRFLMLTVRFRINSRDKYCDTEICLCSQNRICTPGRLGTNPSTLDNYCSSTHPTLHPVALQEARDNVHHSSGMWWHVILCKFTDVSEERTASICRVEE